MKVDHSHRARVCAQSARRLLLCAAIPSLASASAAMAQTFVWSGNGGNANWNFNTIGVYSNWSPSLLPPSNAHVVFGSGFNSGNPNLNGDRGVATLTIDAGTNFSLVGGAGDTLTITSGNIIRTAASSGTHTISVATARSSGGSVNINGTGTLVFAGAMSGGNFDKHGTGVVQFGTGAGDTTANTYIAPTTVHAGLLVLNKAQHTDAVAGNLVLQGGQVFFNRGHQINDDRLVTINAGTLLLGNSEDTVAGLTGSGGTLSLANGTLTLAQNTLSQFGGSITSGTGQGAIYKQGIGTQIFSGNGQMGRLVVGGGTAQFSGGSHSFTNNSALTPAIHVASGANMNLTSGANVIVNAVGVARIDGSLWLSGASTFSGATEVVVGSAGGLARLDLGGSSSFTTNRLIVGRAADTIGQLTVGTGSRLTTGELFVGVEPDSVGGVFVASSTANLNATQRIGLGGSGSLSRGGVGTLEVASFASVTTAETTFWTSQSALTVNQGSFTAGTLRDHEGEGGTIRISDIGSLSPALTVGTASVASYGGVIANFAGPGSVRKVGAGTQTLFGQLTYTGQTIIDAGVLDLADPQMSGGATVSVNAAGTLRARGHVPRPLAGTGSLALSGNLTIGDLASTNGVQFGGRLLVGGNTLGLLDADLATLSGTVTLNNGRISSLFGTSLAASGQIIGSGTIANNFVNDGLVNATGAGLVFPGVVSGAGTFLGNVTFAGLYSPGNSPASVTLGSPTFDGALRIELGGTTPGTQHDHLRILGAATLGGSLGVRLIDGFVALPGQQFDIMTFASRSGEFAVANETGFAGLRFTPVYTPTSLSLLAGALLAGDANLDARVNLSDFNILAANFGQSGQTWLTADFDGNGIVNLSDFNILAANFGVAAAGPDVTPDDWAALSAAVPEPAGTACAVSLLAGALLRRRRK